MVICKVRIQVIIKQIIYIDISARRNFFGGGDARSIKGGLVRGSPRGGFRGRSPPDAGEVFKKLVKNQ